MLGDERERATRFMSLIAQVFDRRLNRRRTSVNGPSTVIRASDDAPSRSSRRGPRAGSSPTPGRCSRRIAVDRAPALHPHQAAHQMVKIAIN